jgi:hypothetical protein
MTGSNFPQASPREACHARLKGRRIEDSPFLPRKSVQLSTPFHCGNFVPLCGAPSHEQREGHGCLGAYGITKGGAVKSNLVEDDQDTTVLIAKAMNQLSIKDREQAYEDLHGVSAAVHETPALITESFHNLEQCLQKIRHKPAYDMAQTIQSSYVQDPRLCLMLLRAERFDANKAASRMVKFLDWKLKLFGPERLCQWHIGLDDLDADARFMVESGLSQVLPERDSRGRVVSVVAANYIRRLQRSCQSILQMSYYTMMSIVEDEANQISGVVSICYGLGTDEMDMSAEARRSTWEGTSLVSCMPVRGEGVHFCTPSSGMNIALNLIGQSVGMFLRSRIRIHSGSHLECEYALLSFGLPIGMLPFTTESELKLGNHKNWVQRRIVKEQELKIGEGSFSGIDLPGRNDVLLGQGKPIQEHPGNLRLHDLVRLYMDEYNQANRTGGRTIVTRKIIHDILFLSPLDTNSVGGGRFLKRRDDNLKNGWWEEVTDEEVVFEKVSNAIRGIRKRHFRNQPTGRVTVPRITYDDLGWCT